MPLAKQARDCRIGDILLYGNEENRIITDIDHRGDTHRIRTTVLAGESPRFDTYDASDEINTWDNQGALF